ncbi:ABC transporter ATP-binding protein [Halorientalis sp. IM1011]|uniref:ABC transporter ATP-binding protein n=1 Tax=Halorientalis sp. IM1011 TaxID=1932360 RepID=UPI00097CC66A|nr:ABC transporter ATP-binding protein [Halorientalis sp. IM1011]AQL44489.1 ABC transporter ATP-binding protein [Halorientalis sp. IM1011]
MSKEVAGTDGDEGSVVHCADVVREYRRGGGGFFGGDGTAIRAVDGVTLSIDAGEVVGIAGPSGSGKTTLLHLLAGLDTPSAGTVTLAGTDVGSLSERGRARHRLDHVGIVFQRFHLLPSLTATSNVALPLVERGVGKRTRRERAREALESVGLEDRADHRPGQLSGGERQRVAIARALITEPDLVVADEPTGELDTETSARVLDVLTDLATDRAVVLASHDDQALAAGDRLVRLRDGAVTGEDRAP